MDGNKKTGVVKVRYTVELLAGLTVAFAQMPEAMAFAIIAGLSPLTGLYTAFTVGIITSAFGGRPGIISGAAGATAIVIIDLVKTHGAEYVFAAIILGGIIQLVAQLLKFGRFIRLVSAPVMLGFVNGLAIIIFFSQVAQFKVSDVSGTHWLSGTSLYIMIALVLLTILIIWLLPRLTKIIPGSLAALVVVYMLSSLLKVPTKTIGDIAAIQGGFPLFHFPYVPLTWSTLMVILPFALIIAGVGIIESLLTLNIVDEKIQSRGNSSREILALGSANVISGFFSGMGGCAMLGQSMINISAGARTRISGIAASLMILVFIRLAPRIIESVPVAALTGIMIVVAIKTFDWSIVKIFKKMPVEDIIVALLVAAITVCFNNLALAVVVGTILSALVFSWKSEYTLVLTNVSETSGVKKYSLTGPLYFGSVRAFQEKFEISADPNEVRIDLRGCTVFDMSGLLALHKLTKLYEDSGKLLVIQNLSPTSEKLLKKAYRIMNIHVVP